jgi:hypothetical protein
MIACNPGLSRFRHHCERVQFFKWYKGWYLDESLLDPCLLWRSRILHVRRRWIRSRKYPHRSIRPFLVSFRLSRISKILVWQHDLLLIRRALSLRIVAQLNAGYTLYNAKCSRSE